MYDDTWNWEKSTYYVRDPQGNVMAVYDQQVQSSTMSYKVKERDIYGSSRVGMYTDTVEMIGAVLDTTNSNHVMGARVYELSNHLGNVLATITDKVIPKDWNSDATIDNYHADLVTSTDYYAFGVTMKLRDFVKKDYRYHFNGKETDGETDWQDYGFRIYRPEIARFISVDPLCKKYPELTPYQFASLEPIANVDLDGLEKANATSSNEVNPNGVSVPAQNTTSVPASPAVGLINGPPAPEAPAPPVNFSFVFPNTGQPDGQSYSTQPQTGSFNVLGTVAADAENEGPVQYGVTQWVNIQGNVTVTPSIYYPPDGSDPYWVADVSVVAKSYNPLLEGFDVTARANSTVNTVDQPQQLLTDPPPSPGGTLISTGAVSAGTTRIVLPKSGAVQIEVEVQFSFRSGDWHVSPSVPYTFGTVPLKANISVPLPSKPAANSEVGRGANGAINIPSATQPASNR